MPVIDDDGRRHGVELRVEARDIVPFNDDEPGVSVFQTRRGALGVFNVGESLSHVPRGYGVIRDHVRPTLSQPFDDGSQTRVPDVVGAGFECEAEDGDALTGDVDVECLADVPDVVDEADLRSDELVVDVLDNPRFIDARFVEWWLDAIDERLKHFLERVKSDLIIGSG